MSVCGHIAGVTCDNCRVPYVQIPSYTPVLPPMTGRMTVTFPPSQSDEQLGADGVVTINGKAYRWNGRAWMAA